MIIDRIEGSQAVIELGIGRFKNVPLSNIQGRARDGAVLKETSRPDFYEVDEQATQNSKARIDEKVNRLFI